MSLFPINFREALLSDIFIIQVIANKSWRATYTGLITNEQIDYLLRLWYSQSALERLIQDQDYKFYLVIDIEEPIGFFSYFPDSENKHLLRIGRIYLLPEAQGKGYGSQIMKFIESFGRELGFKSIELNVNQGNSAIRFYEKRGFEILWEENIQMDNHQFIDLVMGKSI
jgi:GNAT superfamily N-acetyltransferase